MNYELYIIMLIFTMVPVIIEILRNYGVLS
jgi:hypothetical protein